MIKGLNPFQILGKLTSQREKERYEVCWKEGSNMEGQQLYRKIHTFYQDEPLFI